MAPKVMRMMTDTAKCSLLRKNAENSWIFAVTKTLAILTIIGAFGIVSLTVIVTIGLMTGLMRIVKHSLKIN